MALEGTQLKETPPKTRIRFDVSPWLKQALRRAADQRETTITGYLRMVAQQALKKDGVEIVRR
jgi:hypothetical protein